MEMNKTVNIMRKLIYRLFGRKLQLVFNEDYYAVGDWIFDDKNNRLLVVDKEVYEDTIAYIVKGFKGVKRRKIR